MTHEAQFVTKMLWLKLQAIFEDSGFPAAGGVHTLAALRSIMPYSMKSHRISEIP